MLHRIYIKNIQKKILVVFVVIKIQKSCIFFRKYRKLNLGPYSRIIYSEVFHNKAIAFKRSVTVICVNNILIEFILIL